MSDLEGYRSTTTQVAPSASGGGCGAPWFWIILFIISLLVIAGLVVFLIYAWRKKDKDRLIDFKGAKIKVNADYSLTGTWPSTGKTEDKVTLWATLDPPLFNPDGTLSNTNAVKQATLTGADSVTLSGLLPLKYYATLVATNSDTSNYQVYTQIVSMDVTVPSSTDTNKVLFAIEDIIQVGKVQLASADGTIVFNQRPSEAASLWKYVNGQIQTDDASPICIYNNNGTLASKPCADLVNNLNDSKWTYNQGKFANQWCLSNTINTTNATATPLCMALGTISAGTATISVTSSTNASNAFVNAFENK